ncbi:hypothetical protein CGLO_07797 [Colletotrichum gloeosporioides Cg-14]|uniref:Zn(2)-C6 fungal-type domain-containing protein n=1 Tax=Colletotrichum gloeosporioides (strain Cg-14) TaxID=1237896 RepID=T0LW20_COLGC|nr:hypothetical protein CGLO_07797 [Colletotrichum gloeosporioides Cg-14]
MDHQSQNEQLMERGVTQAGSDDVVISNNEIHPQAFPPATHEELFNFHVEEEDEVFYERLTETLRIDAQSPPNNLLDAEQDMVTIATDEANNGQALFDPQALPQLSLEQVDAAIAQACPNGTVEELSAAIDLLNNHPVPFSSNLLGLEQDKVAIATEGTYNGQATFQSQACPQLPCYNSPYSPYGNYQSNVANTLPSQPQYVNPAELQNNGGNSCQRVVTQQMANPGTGFLGTGGFDPRTIAQVPKPSEYMDVDSVPGTENIDPALLEDTVPGPIHNMSGHMDIDFPVAGQLSTPGRAPISGNGNGNGNDEGNGNGDDDDADADLSLAPPQPLIVPEALRANTAGNRVEKKPNKRQVGKKACSGCRKSKLRCNPVPGGNTCLECLQRSRPCDKGQTTDDRTREANRDKLLRTVERCEKYLADLLLLIYSMKIAMDQGKLNDKMTMIRSQLSSGLTEIGMLVYYLTDQPLTPQDEQSAHACVRLDALAGLQLDLQGIEENLAEMRKTGRLCVERTKDRVKTLGQYLNVVMNDKGHVRDAQISLGKVKGSRTPFSQIGTDMSVQFSNIADNSDIVPSLVGHVDKLKAV